MEAKYLCQSWVGLLQMVVFLLSRGYQYCLVQYLPDDKRDRWTKIDQKLMAKYNTIKSKWQRARQKSRGVACFYYLRWNNIVVICHTAGDVSQVEYTDRFSNILITPTHIKISELTELVVRQNSKAHGFSVFLSSTMYRGVKDSLLDIAKAKDKSAMIAFFNRLNGLPAWGGIVTQKQQLARFLVKMAGRHQVDLTLSELRIRTKRTPVKVFVDDQPETHA